MTRRNWFTSLLPVAAAAPAIAQPPTASIANGLGRERLDFITAEGQTVFPTNPVFPRSNYVEVYRNGLLQRPGSTADYTQVTVPGGTVRVTFNPPPAGGPIPSIPVAGDYVTLFYYR